MRCTLFVSTILIFLAVPDAYGQITTTKPNIVLIYTDDVGYGDIGCYGTSAVPTPNIDRLATQGTRFTSAHASSATCTPSRFSILTGKYAWRRKGTNIAPGDAPLIIPVDGPTLPRSLSQAGYATAVVGKWHLGLGPESGPDWNNELKPGPLELGFDYAFIIPATGDRVPCVFVENYRVVHLDPKDPIKVSYHGPVDANAPTGKDNPELLKMLPSNGHDMTIVNGVSRIGYMRGGTSALWVDEDFADILSQKAVSFIDRNRDRPFFLYFSTHDIHVPRMPHERFVGKSGLGPRGDAIVQLDWTVGQLMTSLENNGLLANTLVIFTSDNGPVLDDGYRDEAIEKIGRHRQAGPYRGGKYSAFEAGTRVPFITMWKGHVPKNQVSPALISQIDLFASLAHLAEAPMADGASTDSQDHMEVLLNHNQTPRDWVVEQSENGTLSLILGHWKYIEPHNGPAIERNTHIELGNLDQPQLYHLPQDAGEAHNLAGKYPGRVREMGRLLEKIRNE